MFWTLEVLKLDTFNAVNFLSPENMYDIFVTFLVSKLDTFNDVR